MEPLYVIIHGKITSIEQELRRIQNKPLDLLESIISELQKIRDEQTFIDLPLSFLPRNIPYDPKDKNIFLCGAYGDIFVASHLKFLEEYGIPAQIYKSATLFTRDSILCTKREY